MPESGIAGLGGFDREMVLAWPASEDLAPLGESWFTRPVFYFPSEDSIYVRLQQGDPESFEVLRRFRAIGLQPKKSGDYQWVKFSPDKNGPDPSIRKRVSGLPGVKGDFFVCVGSGRVMWRIRFPEESLDPINDLLLLRENHESDFPLTADYLGPPRGDNAMLSSCRLSVKLSRVTFIEKNNPEYVSKAPQLKYPYHQEWKYIARKGSPLTEIRFSNGQVKSSGYLKVTKVIRSGPPYITEEEFSSPFPQYFMGEDLVDSIVPLFFGVDYDGEVQRITWILETEDVNNLISRSHRLNTDKSSEGKLLLESVSDFKF